MSCAKTMRVQVRASLSGSAHGADYRGVEKETVLRGLLWHGQYRGLLVLIFSESGTGDL